MADHRSLAIALLAVLASPAAARAQAAPAPTQAAEPPPHVEAPPSPAGIAPVATVSLEEAVKRATARNPSAVVAVQEIRRAEGLVREARASSMPSLFGSATYTRLDADRTLSGRVIAAQDSLSANLNLNVPILAPQRWASWSRAGDGVDVAKIGMAEARRQIAIGVASAYLAIISQRRVVEINERARDTAKAHFEFARTRLTGGVGNRIDAVRAEQELATDEAQVEVAKAALARAREALGVLMGENGPVDAEAEPSLASPPSLADALGRTRTRGDVKAQAERTRAAEHSSSLDWTDYSPYLVGVFQPFYQNPASLTQPLTGWQAQLILTVPFYDGGLRYGQAEERGALAAEARAQLDGTVRQAQSDVRAAFEALTRADAGLGSARNAARLADEALALANLAYKAGTTTNLEVIDAERRARDAQTAAAVAEDGARQARLGMLVASGAFPGGP